MGWLFANLFLLAVVLIAAGTFFVFGTLISLLHLTPSIEGWAMGLAVILSLICTFFLTKALHGFIGKRI